MDVQTARQEALTRVRGRRHPPKSETRMLGNGTTTQMQVDTPEFLGPVNASEWLDDRVLRTTMRDPAGEALCAIAEAARGSDAAIAEAVRAAATLTVWQQWRLYWTLKNEWEQRQYEQRDAPRVMSAILQAWKRAGLVMTRPGEPEPATITDVNAAELKAADARRLSWRR